MRAGLRLPFALNLAVEAGVFTKPQADDLCAWLEGLAASLCDGTLTLEQAHAAIERRADEETTRLTSGRAATGAQL